MAFISISITKNHPLILGKGGFGRQLADWLSAEGWGEAEFLDDNAPGCVGGLRDYADPKLLKPGRPARPGAASGRAMAQRPRRAHR